jgi:streptomycin 6-kinase
VSLEANLVAAARRWGVVLAGPPLRAGGRVVAFGRDTSGRAVVAKLASADSDEALTGPVLRHFDGAGSVRVLAVDGAATLQERIAPADSLSGLVAAGEDDAATGHLCAIAAAMHHAGLPSPAVTGVPTAAFATVAGWGQAFARYLASGSDALPTELVERAADLYAQLESTQGPACLLHGDLQHYNVLRDAVRGWLAIDPKGVIGEPEFEFGPLLRNPSGGPAERFADPAVVRRRIAIIHDRLGLNQARLLGWGFATCVLSAIWSWEDGESPESALRTARAIGAVMEGR